MRSNSYRDIMRYLQVVAPAVKITPNYFVVKDITIVPHNKASLFPSKLPVRADVVQKIDQQSVYYGVSHADGEIYVQTIPELKKYIGSELIEGNYLIPIDQFKKIEDVLPYSEAGKFIHTHLHSEYSSLDGMAKTEAIARRCKQLGMPAVALTDHGTMSGVIEFYKNCKKYGVKPIIGQEFYVDDDRFQKGVPDDVKKAHKKAGDGKALNRMWEREHRVNQRRHLVLLAKSYEGLRNLYRLSSLGYIEGFYFRPRIDWALLKKYKEGLIVTTACAAGYLGEKESPKYRAHFLKKLIGIFGRDNLYLEIMLHDYEKQPELNDFVIDVHKKTGIPMICTVDAHYVDPDPNHIHQLYLRIGAGYEYGGGHNYIKSWGELRDTYEKFFKKSKHGWDKYAKALSTTLEIADRCNVEIELGKFKMPQFDLSSAVVPANPGETDVQYLVRRTKEGFRERISSVVPKDQHATYMNRLKYELKTFIDAGYVNYTLIVLDMIDYAKSMGRLVVVRGSAAGSLLCYCLKMTSVDPIKNNLLFERFVSPLRAGLVDKSYQSPPDIDVDYPNRDEMIEYAAKKYGEDSVARIGTCNRMQVRQSIKSMAEATQFMSFSDANRITKTIPDSSKTLEDALRESIGLHEWYEQSRNKKWVDTYVDSVIGIAGHHSIHAAGIVIAPGKIIDYLPVQVQEKKKESEKSQNKDRVVTTQLEGDSIEEIGLLKFDVLRVRTLAHLKRTQELIYERRGKMIDFNKIDLDNPKYFKGFQNKDTQGVFQMDTKATSNLLNHTTIRCFDDVVAVVSLSRPGTAGPGLDIEYCERKKGKPFEYDHPLLKPVLKDTYGIPIFQEQIMQMVNVLGGMSLVEADKFRKMMKKKDVAQMGSYRERFLAGAIERGVKNREEAMKIWEKIVSWSSYGFCKAHATAYAQLSVWTMVMKQLFPLEFYIGWLENPKNKDQLIMIYRDMIKHKIPVIFPNVNQSKTRFYISDKSEIVWALKGIKYVGEPVAQAIADNAPYSSMKDFVEKTKGNKVTKRSIDPLICINAFPWCDSPKQAANEYYKYREEPVPAHFLSDDKKYWNRRFHEFTGYYREDPLDIYANELAEYGKLDTLDEFKDLECGMGTKLAGYITNYRSLESKRGMMAIFSIEVELQEIKIVAWNSFYKNSVLDGMEPNDLIGRFVFVFGDRDIDDRNNDQVQLGNVNNDKFEIID